MAKRRIQDSDEEAQTISTVQSSDIEDMEVGAHSSEYESSGFSDGDDGLDSLIGDVVYDTNTEDAYNAASPYEAGDAPSQQPGADGDDGAASGGVFGHSVPLESKLFRQELQTALVKFFTGSEKYAAKIRAMCSENGESLEVEYADVVDTFAVVETDPEIFLLVLSDALTAATRYFFPSYHLIRKKIIGRIVCLPVAESLRNLRNSHLNKLVCISGIVTRRTGVFSEYSLVKYTCAKCRATFGPFVHNTSAAALRMSAVPGGAIPMPSGKSRPLTCFECQGNGPFIVNTAETIYKDYQRITLQELPRSVPPGSLPRSREVVLCYDLIDACKPGDEIDVVGVYKNSYSAALNAKNGFPVFSTLIEASSVRKEAGGAIELTTDDIKEIKALARHPAVVDKLADAVCTSIYGHRNVKMAVLLAMVGGETKEKEGTRIRGDINVLLMGDPGTAKSQFLRFVHAVSHRAVLATGQGSSSVGLTASVRKDTALNEWVLEGGALVLADSGVCLIDEFDKMGEGDRVAIHEAMEQQSISISKAGIVASLHARCAVIAAANPIRGRYNPALSFAQNINLSDPIVSRFDLLCVIQDTVDVAEDRRMGEFILGNHLGNREAAPGSLGLDMLRKYILYAKTSIHPRISHIDTQKIAQLYSDLRKESLGSGIPITVRHVESIIRISEAHAKLRLSSAVCREDIDAAIGMALASFLGAQKYSVSKQLRKKFSKYFDENNDDLAVFILKQMAAETLAAIAADRFNKSDFIARCKNNGLSVGERFFSTRAFADAGFVLSGSVIQREAS
ncbi:DNA replication licensing factor MCM2 [Pancytospora philotis]|nr:DNA replication licensing factor MCM2 [Pancytospora philotis]